MPTNYKFQSVTAALISSAILLCLSPTHSEGTESVFETVISCNEVSSKINSICWNGSKLGSHFCSSQKWLAEEAQIELVENDFTAYRWACLPSNNGYKVIFYLGNTGNCNTCEGFEIWNPDGTQPSELLTTSFDKEYKRADFPAKQGEQFWNQFNPIKQGLPADNE